MDETMRFLLWLGRRHDEDTFSFRLISDRDKAATTFQFPDATWDHRGEDILSISESENYGVYVVVNAGGYTNQEIVRVRALYADLDNESDIDGKLKLLHKLGAYPHAVIQTSPCGYHLYWMIDREEFTPEEFSELQQLFVDRIGADPACKNIARLMRLPGTRNHKAKYGELGFLVRILELHDHAPYSIDLIRAALATPVSTPKPEAIATVPVDAKTDEVAIIAASSHADSVNGVGKGQRNHKAYQLAAQIKDFGLTKDEALPLLDKWNSKNKPPLNYKELVSALNHAYKYAKLVAPGERNPAAIFAAVAIPDGDMPAPQGTLPLDIKDPRGAAQCLLRDLWDNGRRLAYVDQEFYQYTQRGEWVKVSQETLESRLSRELYAHGNITQKNIREVRDFIKNILAEDARVPETWLDRRHGTFLAMRNGILNLETKELVAHSPDFFSNNYLGFDYIPGLISDRWNDFLDSIWGHDEDIKQALRKWFGYCIDSDCSRQKIALLIGESRAGKGVMCSILDALIGSGVRTTTLNGLSGDFGLQGMDKARLIQIRDIAKGSNHNGRIESALETIRAISGRDPVTIHRKYLPSLDSVKIGAKIVITANELPGYADAKGALANRMVVFPFNKSFRGKEDIHLLRDLMSEISAIFNWALVGYDVLRGGSELHQPRIGELVLEDIKLSTDAVLAFVSDCVELPDADEHGVYTSTDDIYRIYRSWAVANGRSVKSKNGMMRDFVGRVRDRLGADESTVYVSTARGVGGKVVKIVRGVRVLESGAGEVDLFH